jgi:formylglycine-generating enzyme required for sulfatase activity/uncharacterized caspase-like protein
MQRAAVFIIVTFLALAAAGAAEAKRVALVIGINVYDNLSPNQQLVKAGNDARAVASAFKEVGFQVILAEDTGRTAFLKAWQRFLDTVAPGDVTALFFSGHGIEINGSNYLLVRDIPPAADGEEVLKNSGFRLQALMDRLKEQRPQVSILIVDACRDNPYANLGGRRGLGSARGLKPEEPARGTLIMMSAGTGQEALDALSATDPDPNSVYTRTLLPLLKEPGLEITDLAKRLRGNVEALAATVRHEQRPAFYHELSGDFYLVPKPEAAPAIALSGASEAALVWGTIRDTTSPAVLEAFARQFGGTVYAGLARARLEELKRTQVATTLPPSEARAARPSALPDARSPQPAKDAGQTWLAIKDMSDPAVFETFIAQFGATLYAPAARARLDQLKRTAAAPPAAQSTAPMVSPPAGVAAARTGPEPSAATTAKPEPRGPPSVYEAAQAWATVRLTKSTAELEAFLGRFGDTIYGPMARTQLQQLKTTQVAAAASPAPAPSAPEADRTTPAAVTPPAQAPIPPAAIPAVGIFPAPRMAAPLSASEERALKPHDSFTECAQCPEMIVVPPGSFTMGSPPGEAGRAANEGPENRVTFARAFAAAKYAVTFEEWDACVDGGGCNGYRPADEGRPRGHFPVVNVSWEDATAYAAWLSKSTGKPYRLLSEAEREYVTRAGTTTPFWFGPSISTKQANYDGSTAYGGGDKGEFRQRSVPVDSFAANSFGLHQVHGNVNEWVTDCWRSTYQETTPDGSASTAGDCGRRVLRGGSWYDGAQELRAAARIGFYPGYRSNKIGFRVARPL